MASDASSTVGRLRVLSRQWWEMTPHFPELARLAAVPRLQRLQAHRLGSVTRIPGSAGEDL
jgi:hypothetical protein